VALSVAHHEIAIRDLDPAHDGLVVAHLSDVHVGLITPERRIRRAVELANQARPDIVLLTGDYVCYARKFVPLMGELLSGLQASAGVVATLGNHDHWTDTEGCVRALAGNGYHVLRNQNVELRPRGVRLTLAGIDDAVTRNHDVNRAFAGISAASGTTLCLTHCPELADGAVARGAKLVVAGHTHGGHFHVQGLTERLYRKVTKRRYLSGWYEVGEALLYVNRGIGSSSVPVRAGAGAQSEVGVFTLRRAEAA
jgi:predicted MPP superfamily phosphohydrolase